MEQMLVQSLLAQVMEQALSVSTAQIIMVGLLAMAVQRHLPIFTLTLYLEILRDPRQAMITIATKTMIQQQQAVTSMTLLHRLALPTLQAIMGYLATITPFGTQPEAVKDFTAPVVISHHHL